MTQPSLQFTRDSQANMILQAMLRGRRLTCLDILREFRCMNGKGRIHELRRAGHKIADRWIETEGGARVKQYFVER